MRITHLLHCLSVCSPLFQQCYCGLLNYSTHFTILGSSSFLYSPHPPPPTPPSGGFKLFKQWKERYLVLTVEGSLRVCRDAESPPDQVVALQWNCEAIVEGREILDLPRLPPGGRRDCCFALILPQEKFLLLLADSPEDSTDAFETATFKKVL
uniref:PH domain-containing protein n=1 Tax=Salmo trutta TaxID=8032 RepID=A0A673WVU5_SALTR